MSENLAKLYRAHNPEPESADDYMEDLHPDERKAYAKMLAEAKQNGVTLANEGKGGLPPSKVLGILRRDRWACKRCGDGKDNLSVHHKGHMENPKSKWLAKKGKSNDDNNIVAMCESCHDAVHQEDRAEEPEKEPAEE